MTLSHELNPTIREYRRASSTVIDASLKPLMQEHLGDIAPTSRRAGSRGELVVVTSVGGVPARRARSPSARSTASARGRRWGRSAPGATRRTTSAPAT